MKEIVYPKTMVAMLEQAQAKVKELGLALEQAQETIDRLEMVAQIEQQAADLWRKIADELVYTEHDVYDYYHRPQFSPCARCVAHNAYHDQVDRESNS